MVTFFSCSSLFLQGRCLHELPAPGRCGCRWCRCARSQRRKRRAGSCRRGETREKCEREKTARLLLCYSGVSVLQFKEESNLVLFFSGKARTTWCAGTCWSQRKQGGLLFVSHFWTPHRFLLTNFILLSNSLLQGEAGAAGIGLPGPQVSWIFSVKKK